MGHDCDDYTSGTFKDNVAHSINDPTGGGYGAIIFPDPSRKGHEIHCHEASFFTAYKCMAQGATSLTKFVKIKYSSMTMMDNKLGFGPQAGT